MKKLGETKDGCDTIIKPEFTKGNTPAISEKKEGKSTKDDMGSRSQKMQERKIRPKAKHS